MNEEDNQDLDELLIQVLDETVLLCSQLPPSSRTTLPPPLPSLQRNYYNNKVPVHDPFISYSPPRVFSQRPNDPPTFPVYSNSIKPDSPPISSKDVEIQRLKKELELVSKQLLDKEQECFELRKVESKEAKTKNSHGESKGHCGTTLHASKRTTLKQDVGTSVNGREIDATTGLEDKRSFKTTGVQADLASHADLSKKLQDIWLTSNYQDLRRNLISELLLVCSTDLQILFSFMETSTPSQEKENQ